MAAVSFIQTNFSAGELSPKVLGRVDYSKYNNGCEKLQRFLPMPHGGITKTPGTEFMGEVKDSTKTVRLIPFIFSSIQAYQLEFGDLYVRIFVSAGQVEGSPGVPYEVVTPYLHTEINDLQFAQSADILFIVHPNHAPRRLSRTSLTSWTLTTYDTIDGPYLDENVETTTLTPSGTTGTVTITASSIVGINGGVGFKASDVGRWVRIKHSSTWGWGKITAFTSTTVVSVLVTQAFGAATAVTTWNLGAWSSDLGWPRSITFYEDRLFFGGNANATQTIWGTRSGDYYKFSPTEITGTVTDDNGVVYELASGQVNDIRWLDSTKILVAGTASAEFSISGGSGGEALTPTNVRAFAATNRGSAKTVPIRVDSSVLFVQKSKRKIREYAYDFGSDSYQAIDLTILSDHITIGDIKSLAFQQEPYSVVWVVLANGNLVSLTYNREQEIISWANQPLANGGKAKSVSCIPSVTESYDEVWVIAERVIDGDTVQYVEKFAQEYELIDPDNKKKAFYVDSGLVYEGAAATIISGLDHLIGEEVSIWADGAVQPRRTVNSSGEITLQREASYVVVGLPYRSRMRSIRYEIGGDQGTSQGKKKRIHRVGIRFLNTLGCKFGRVDNESKLEEVYFRSTSDAMDASPPLFTGDRVSIFPGDYDRDGQIEIISDDPTPVTILALMPESVVHG